MDLIILVPDKDMKFAVEGLLEERAHSLAIRPIRYDLYVHPNRDPGCRLEAAEFLRTFLGLYDHALVMLDREGSGREALASESIEGEIRADLARNGWPGNSAAVVIDPELEVWVWADSPNVDSVLGWHGRDPDLRSWLKRKRLWESAGHKPERPKNAVEQALREVSKVRSHSFVPGLGKTGRLAQV